MLEKLIRIDTVIEKSRYVKDNITGDNRHRPVIEEEFEGRKITYFVITLANYLEMGFRIYPMNGNFDNVIPFWYWTTKPAVPKKLKFVD